MRLIYLMLSRPLKACDSVVLLPSFHALELSAHKPNQKFELICLACLLLGPISSNCPSIALITILVPSFRLDDLIS